MEARVTLYLAGALLYRGKEGTGGEGARLELLFHIVRPKHGELILTMGDPRRGAGLEKGGIFASGQSPDLSFLEEEEGRDAFNPGHSKEKSTWGFFFP